MIIYSCVPKAHFKRRISAVSNSIEIEISSWFQTPHLICRIQIKICIRACRSAVLKKNKMEDNPRKRRAMMVHLFQDAARKRRHLQVITQVVFYRMTVLMTCALLALLLIFRRENARDVHRSCRRSVRNHGWWENVLEYTDKRFKANFRISRATFYFILDRIRPDLERQDITEEAVSPECRLAVCLYRLGRGDYYHTISELTGLGLSTVATIVQEVSESIVNCLWEDCVNSHFPKNEAEFKEAILDMEENWQFPCTWSAVDGCHIPMKCPPGGAESRKEYHNFKNFYSIVLMALVDAKYRFIWGSCGYPGNSHDSIILQSTTLWEKIAQGNILPDIAKTVGGVPVPPIIAADSAFPFEKWMMKPYTNAVLSPQQRNFNYRLSRARMVTEGAYGMLKGRWRVLLRKSECSPENLKLVVLACMVLHNVCMDRGETLPRKFDPTIDPVSGERRDREIIRDLLMMTLCRPLRDRQRNSSAERIRKVLTQKLWREKEGGGVC